MERPKRLSATPEIAFSTLAHRLESLAKLQVRWIREGIEERRARLVAMHGFEAVLGKLVHDLERCARYCEPRSCAICLRSP